MHIKYVTTEICAQIKHIISFIALLCQKRTSKHVLGVNDCFNARRKKKRMKQYLDIAAEITAISLKYTPILAAIKHVGRSWKPFLTLSRSTVEMQNDETLLHLRVKKKRTNDWSF